MTSIARPARRVLAVTLAAGLLAACQQPRQTTSPSTADDGGRTPYEQARQLDADGRDGEAVGLYRQAAKAGHPDAAFRLAEAYRRGEGVAQDLAKAAAWYDAAADHGSAQAQYLAGTLYAGGQGGAKNAEKAAGLFARAARQGHVKAQYRLGRAYANGEGVAEDPLLAGRWYGKAARQGNADAQFALGAMLAAGERVPRDLAMGYALLRLATENGVSGAQQLLPAIETRMSTAQRERAGRRLAALRNGPEDKFADPPTVRYVQGALRRLGHDAGPVDGVMGARTRAGIRAFQRAQGLQEDGELDRELLQRVLDAGRAGA